MKIGKFLALFTLAFSVSSSAYEPSEEEVFSQLVECILNVSTEKLANDDIQMTNSLALFNSVLQNIAVESGDTTELDVEYTQLFPIAYKHCPTEIDNIKKLG